MKILTDIVSPFTFTLAMACALVIVFIYLRMKVFRSLFDPSVMVIFQIYLTAFILAFCSFLTTVDFVAYFLLFISILIGSKSKISDKYIVSEDDWVNFAKLFLYLILILNLYLLYKKGFILFQPHQERIKVEFYQGYGIFKRLNEIAVILIGLASVYLFKKGKKKQGILYLCFIMYLIFSLGSKAGLVSFLFILGGILHFYPLKISKGLLFQLLFFSLISVFIMFNLIYEKDVFSRIYYRIVAFADGPVYFYEGNMFEKADYNIMYLFDQILINLRVQSEPQFMSLGHFVIKNYFKINEPLFGPNPQIIIESKVIFKSFFIFYMVFIGFLFGLARRFASTPFSFLFILMFINPLLIDGQYAFNNLFSLGILCFLLIGYFYLKIGISNLNKR